MTSRWQADRCKPTQKIRLLEDGPGDAVPITHPVDLATETSESTHRATAPMEV